MDYCKFTQRVAPIATATCMWYYLLELITWTQVQYRQPSTVGCVYFQSYSEGEPKTSLYSHGRDISISIWSCPKAMLTLYSSEDSWVLWLWVLCIKHHNDIVLIGWMSKKWHVFGSLDKMHGQQKLGDETIRRFRDLPHQWSIYAPKIWGIPRQSLPTERTECFVLYLSSLRSHPKAW